MYFSPRFNRNVWLTDHARAAMRKRSITLEMVRTIIETGDRLDRDDRHCWLYQHFPDRPDNLLCVAAIIDQAVIVKTVMTGWRKREMLL